MSNVYGFNNVYSTSNIFGYNSYSGAEITPIVPITNYVTIDTVQTITASKTFTDNLICQGLYINAPSIVGQNNNGFNIASTGTSPIITISPNNITALTLTNSQVTVAPLLSANAGINSTAIVCTGIGNFGGVTIKDPLAYNTSTLTESGTTLTYNCGGLHSFTGSGMACNTISAFAANSGITTPTIQISANATISAAQLPSNDNSTKVPTTAWVKSNYSSLIGSIVMYGGNSLPAGYLWCDGQSYDYADPTYYPLYLVLGISYLPMQQPVGTSFAVPDMRGVYAAMPGRNITSVFQDSGLSSAVLVGPSGLGIFQHQSIPMIPHAHTTYYPGSTDTAPSPGSQSFYKSGSASLNQTSSQPTGVTAPNGFTNVGSNVTPVSIGINYIIKY